MWTTDFSEDAEDAEEADGGYYGGEKKAAPADQRPEAAERSSKEQPIIAQQTTSGDFAQERTAPGVGAQRPPPPEIVHEPFKADSDSGAIAGLPPDLDLSLFNEDERAHLIAMFSKAQEMDTPVSRSPSPLPPQKTPVEPAKALTKATPKPRDLPLAVCEKTLTNLDDDPHLSATVTIGRRNTFYSFNVA
jgi:hypothetical protein